MSYKEERLKNRMKSDFIAASTRTTKIEDDNKDNDGGGTPPTSTLTLRIEDSFIQAEEARKDEIRRTPVAKTGLRKK